MYHFRWCDWIWCSFIVYCCLLDKIFCMLYLLLLVIWEIEGWIWINYPRFIVFFLFVLIIYLNGTIYWCANEYTDIQEEVCPCNYKCIIYFHCCRFINRLNNWIAEFLKVLNKWLVLLMKSFLLKTFLLKTQCFTKTAKKYAFVKSYEDSQGEYNGYLNKPYVEFKDVTDIQLDHFYTIALCSNFLDSTGDCMVCWSE